MKRILLNISEELKKELQEEAKLKGLNLNSYIRLILTGRSK